MDEKKAIKILIIDDDVSVRDIYVNIFKKEGFEVEEAIDGVDGLDRATKNVPNVVFTGIVMPRMDGFGLIEALKKGVSTANIPIVISSHLGRKEDEEKAREMGVRDFIVRHMVTPKEAVERVRKVLGATEYRVKIDKGQLDASKLARDFHFPESYQCEYCGADLVLSLSVDDLNQHQFITKIMCPRCNKFF